MLRDVANLEVTLNTGKALNRGLFVLPQLLNNMIFV